MKTKGCIVTLLGKEAYHMYGIFSKMMVEPGKKWSDVLEIFCRPHANKGANVSKTKKSLNFDMRQICSATFNSSYGLYYF